MFCAHRGHGQLWKWVGQPARFRPIVVHFLKETSKDMSHPCGLSLGVTSLHSPLRRSSALGEPITAHLGSCSHALVAWM